MRTIGGFASSAIPFKGGPFKNNSNGPGAHHSKELYHGLPKSAVDLDVSLCSSDGGHHTDSFEQIWNEDQQDVDVPGSSSNDLIDSSNHESSMSGRFAQLHLKPTNSTSSWSKDTSSSGNELKIVMMSKKESSKPFGARHDGTIPSGTSRSPMKIQNHEVEESREPTSEKEKEDVTAQVEKEEPAFVSKKRMNLRPQNSWRQKTPINEAPARNNDRDDPDSSDSAPEPEPEELNPHSTFLRQSSWKRDLQVSQLKSWNQVVAFEGREKHAIRQASSQDSNSYTGEAEKEPDSTCHKELEKHKNFKSKSPDNAVEAVSEPTVASQAVSKIVPQPQSKRSSIKDRISFFQTIPQKPMKRESPQNDSSAKNETESAPVLPKHSEAPQSKSQDATANMKSSGCDATVQSNTKSIHSVPSVANRKEVFESKTNTPVKRFSVPHSIKQTVLEKQPIGTEAKTLEVEEKPADCSRTVKNEIPVVSKQKSFFQTKTKSFRKESSVARKVFEDTQKEKGTETAREEPTELPMTLEARRKSYQNHLKHQSSSPKKHSHLKQTNATEDMEPALLTLSQRRSLFDGKKMKSSTNIASDAAALTTSPAFAFEEAPNSLSHSMRSPSLKEKKSIFETSKKKNGRRSSIESKLLVLQEAGMKVKSSGRPPASKRISNGLEERFQKFNLVSSPSKPKKGKKMSFGTPTKPAISQTPIAASDTEPPHSPPPLSTIFVESMSFETGTLPLNEDYELESLGPSMMGSAKVQQKTVQPLMQSRKSLRSDPKTEDYISHTGTLEASKEAQPQANAENDPDESNLSSFAARRSVFMKQSSFKPPVTRHSKSEYIAVSKVNKRVPKLEQDDASIDPKEISKTPRSGKPSALPLPPRRGKIQPSSNKLRNWNPQKHQRYDESGLTEMESTSSDHDSFDAADDFDFEGGDDFGIDQFDPSSSFSIPDRSSIPKSSSWRVMS